MAVIATNFLKIVAERKSSPKGKVSIKNNVGISTVEKANLSIGKAKEDALRMQFDFNTKYEPKLGEISITGEIVYLNTPDKIKAILEGWKKDKAIPREIMTEVLNNILNKCNIQALVLSRDIGLPAPVQLPRVKVKE